MARPPTCLGLAAALLTACSAAGAPSPALRLEYMLPMRDGVRLHTLVDMPVAPAGGATKLPAIIERSPYGADFEEVLATLLAEVVGYVAVRQDFRGTKQSEGNFTCWHDANDAYDTLEWITQQAWSNGSVFATGGSADGIDAYAQAANPHPALRGTVTIFATMSSYDTFYPGGAYRNALIEGWLQQTIPTQKQAMDTLVRAQEQPGQPWWDAVNGTLFFDKIAWPSLHWAGHYDIFARCAPACPRPLPRVC